MSSVVWDKDNLIQRFRNHVEELGHVKFDPNSNNYVLWLKDTRDVFGINKGYVRAESFPSMRDAKQNAAFSVSAGLFHDMWLVGLRDTGIATDQDIVQRIRDAEGGEPLTVSTFKEELAKIAKTEAESRKRARLYFIIGTVIGLIGAVIGAIGILVGIN